MAKRPRWEIPPPPISDGLAVVDLHTHTYFSGDSNTLIDEYIAAFRKSNLTHVAVTDHQSIDAYSLLAPHLGDKIVCGQEQRVKEGEVIGLFLAERIPPGLSLKDASTQIRQQGGIVYLCHPMDNLRTSLNLHAIQDALENSLIDVIEYCNSKSLKLNAQIKLLASQYQIPLFGGSDAHVPAAMGTSGTAMHWFESSTTFLESAKSAVPFGKYCDPPRQWIPKIIPEV